jgi:Glyoxalase-like domain
VLKEAGMTSYIAHTTVDSADPYALSRWWQQVLDYVENPDDPNLPGDQECPIFSRDGVHEVLFVRVPEAKQAKNRIHFDLRPADGTRDEELERLIGLGAKPVDDLRQPDGTGWVMLTDPEGNEFCILRSRSELG